MTGESGFAKEPTGAQGQLLHALVMRDLGCALRNRTVLMTIITVLGILRADDAAIRRVGG